MRGIDTAFQGLQPVALLHHFRDMAMALGHLRPLKAGRWRHFCLGSHVGPDDPTQFDGGIGCGADFMGEAALGRFIHLVDTGAGHIELPAVIHTAQARLLVAPEPQGDQAVRAEFIQQANSPLRVPKAHQLLTQQLHAHRRTIRFGQFLGQQRWNPVAPHRLSHGGSRAVLVTNIFSSWISMLTPPLCTLMSMQPSVTKCATRVNLTRPALDADARYALRHTPATLKPPACALPGAERQDRVGPGSRRVSWAY